MGLRNHQKLGGLFFSLVSVIFFVKCKPHKGRDFVLFSLCYNPSARHSRQSVNTCWMNGVDTCLLLSRFLQANLHCSPTPDR